MNLVERLLTIIAIYNFLVREGESNSGPFDDNFWSLPLGHLWTSKIRPPYFKYISAEYQWSYFKYISSGYQWPSYNHYDIYKAYTYWKIYSRDFTWLI